jgi:VCBS repeat-containing protein
MRSKKHGRHFGIFSRVLHQLFKQAGSPRQSRPRRFEKLDERTVFSAPAPIVFSFDTSYDGFAEVPGYTGGEYALVASDATASAPHSGAKFLRLRINDQNSARTNTLEQRMARNFDTRPGDTFFGWGIFDDNVNSATTPSVRRIRGQMDLRDVATGTIAKSFWYQTERFDWNTDPGESPDSVDWSGLSKVTFRLDEQLPNFRDARFAIDDLTWSRPDNAVDDHFDVDAGGIAARNILANDRYVRLGADAVVTIGSELGEGQVGVPLRGKYGSLTIYSNGDAWYTADPLAHLAPWHPPLSDAFAPGVRDQITVGTTNEIQNGFYNQQNLYVAIRGVNDAPIAQELSARTVNENNPIGTIIGLFSTTDVDHDDLHTYSLVDGEGGQDNDSFEIVGSSLRTKVSVDFETKSSYSIRVRSTDRGGKWVDRPYEITVKNLNEPPNAGADDSTFTTLEDSSYTFSSGDFLFTDPDAGDYMSGVRIDTVPSRGVLRLAGVIVVPGQVIATARIPELTFTPNQDDNGLNYASFTFSVIDAAGTAEPTPARKSINVTAVNDAPVRTTGNPSPISVLEDSANTTAVSLGLSSLNYGPGGGSDENTQTITYTITAIPSAIQIFKADGTTSVLVNQALSLLELQGLKYKTIPNANGSGSLTWTIKDNGGTANGGVDTATDSLSVTVTAVNDAPTDITLTPNSIPENAAPNSTVGTLRSIDSDTGNTFSYALVAGLGDNDNSAFRISGSLLRTTQSFDYETKSSYSIRVKSTDQGGLSTQKVLVINVIDVNDAPRFVDPEYEFEVADGSRQDNGSQANNGQWRPSISRDGRFVAFVSYATNLAANDFEMDVFVTDTFSGNVVEVSNTQSGGRSNGDSFNPTITPDGRFLVFESYASNLVPEDTSPTGDIFLRDLQTGTLERISTSSTGTAGNDRSYSPSISDDGRFVAFRSDATNLVDGDTNDRGDIFIKDRLTGELSRVSITFDGSQGNNHSFEPAISGDGNKVAFRSYASNLVAGVDNNFEDIYVKDLRTGSILRANTSTNGQQGNNAVWVPSLSYDGRFLSFPSTASNLVPGDTNAAWDVFLKDLDTGETTRVSTTVNGTQGNGASNYATISGDGRYVTFLSFASNLVPDDTNEKADVFLKDTLMGTITRVSTSSDRTQANDASSEAFVSAAGNLVAFTSTATNLVPNDNNGVPDIFIKNLITGETKLAVGNNSRVLIGQVSGTDQDANSVLRYTLTGPGADAFVINPITGQIELSSTGVMDFNLQPTYALTALVSDGVLSSTVPVTIHVTNGNNRPIDILLSSSSIEENMEENTLVGSLSVLDPNPEDFHVYQLVEGLGSDDNASFFIEGANLRAVGRFDFETKSSYSIRIRATDQGDLLKEKIFTIRVIDVDEGFPLLGTTANDAFVATYTGDGIVHAWSVTRNGTILFNGTLPNTSLLIDGLGGTDTLDVVGRSADDVIHLDGSQLFINTAKLRFPRIESIRMQSKEGNDTLTVTTALPSGVTGSFDGGVGLDRLEAVAGTNVWNVLSTDSGSLNSNLTFKATESIQGGANEDQFVLSALGKTTGKILGGGGIDMLSMAAKTLAHTINLQTNTATSTGGIGGIEYFIGSTSATVFDVLIGANSDTNWNIDGTDQGTLSSAVTGAVAFTGFESLTGGTSRDSFVFSDAGRLTKTLTGGTAAGVSDTVDLSEKTAALEFRLDGTSTSVPGSIGTYTGIERLTGNNHANTNVSRSSNTATTWAVDALGNIVVLGASYANVPLIAGGPGTDTLTGPALSSSAVQWIIDSANGGSISLPTIKTITFSSMNGLTGGTGDDVFEIRQAGSISSNLSGGTGTGINTLSYSQWTSGVTVNLSVGTVANATAVGGITSNFQMVTGGSGDDSLRGNASKTTVLIGLAGNDSLVGGTQRDILVAGLGNDLLQGGNGDDLLISGRTLYDLNFDAMKSVLAEWTSTRTFAQRTANLWGNGTGTRSNSNYFLNSQPADDITDTVFADTDNDSLSGGLNQDWFFASLNDLSDFTGTGTAPDRLDP